jgi:NADH pyrophosphatase NudC (nudix superfamily)
MQTPFLRHYTSSALDRSHLTRALPPPLPWSDSGTKTLLTTPRGKVLSSAGRLSFIDTRILDSSPEAVTISHKAYIGIYRGAHLFAAACSDLQADAACALAAAATCPSSPHAFADGRAALGMCARPSPHCIFVVRKPFPALYCCNTLRMCADEGETEALCSGVAILQWQQTHKFCPSCGAPTTLRPDGFKQFCAASGCARHGSPKSIYPSIQPVVISAVLSHDRKRLLMGRKKEWPASRYSCLAGFIEAGESVEQAARREVHEESGVLLSGVQIHSSQSWPFPSQLMVGCISVAAAGGESISKDDDELEDARWFDVADVADAVRETLASPAADQWAPREGAKFTLPPKFAVAFQLLKVKSTRSDTRFEATARRVMRFAGCVRGVASARAERQGRVLLVAPGRSGSACLLPCAPTSRHGD